MKKRVSLILVVFMTIALLAGCGSTPAGQDTGVAEPSPSQEEAQEPSAEAAVETEAPVEDEASAENGSFEDFDPETNTDKINYKDLESTYGPVPTDMEGITMGALMPDLSNEFWSLVSAGVEEACDEYGIEVDLQSAMDTDDMAAQLAMAETMYNNDYDAYVFSPLTDDMLTELTSRIEKDGKPVVNPCGQLVKNADVYVGSMNYQTGLLSGKYVVEQLGGEGRVAYCMGSVGLAVNTNRCQGYTDAFEGTNIEVVAEMPAEWVPENAMNMTVDLLTSDPDIDAILCVNDNLAMGVIEGLRTKDRLGDVLVVGIDGTSDGYAAIAKGELDATIDSFPKECGKLGVEIALRLLDGQKINRVVEGPLETITKDNYQQYQNS